MIVILHVVCVRLNSNIHYYYYCMRILRFWTCRKSGIMSVALDSEMLHSFSREMPAHKCTFSHFYYHHSLYRIILMIYIHILVMNRKSILIGSTCGAVCIYVSLSHSEHWLESRSDPVAAVMMHNRIWQPTEHVYSVYSIGIE